MPKWILWGAIGTGALVIFVLWRRAKSDANMLPSGGASAGGSTKGAGATATSLGTAGYSLDFGWPKGGAADFGFET